MLASHEPFQKRISMPPKKRYQWNPQGNELDDDRPSRSQKKRDSTALQNMGEDLTTLSPGVLAKMPLTPGIRDAVREWHDVASHEGRRRQMQYIGRLMREEADANALREALDSLKAGHAVETVSFKHLEKRRDELMLATSAELDSLLAPYPAEAQTALRDLIARAQNEREHGRPPQSFRALFRKLKELVEGSEASETPESAESATSAESSGA